jgi:PAS domain S-box-containing protein
MNQDQPKDSHSTPLTKETLSPQKAVQGKSKERQGPESAKSRLQSLLKKSDLAMAILDHARDIVMIADMDFRMLYGSPSFQTAAGYTAEEIGNRGVEMFFTPESGLLIRQVLSEQMRSTGKPSREEDNIHLFEVRILTRNGDAISLEMQLSVIRDEKGLPEAFLGVAREITEQSRMEESLRFVERKYQDLFESSNDAIMILDKEGFFDCNRKTLEIFACPSKESFATFHPADLSPPVQPNGENSTNMANRMIDLALEKGPHSFNWMHRRFSGELFPAEVSMSRLALAGRWVVQAVVRDVSDQARAEDEILKSERRFADIINFLPDATFAVDLDGRVIAWNRAMENLTGLLGKDILGKGDYEYAIPFYRKRRPLMIDLLLKNDPETVKNYRKVHWAEGSLYYENDEALDVGNKKRYLWAKASLIYDHNDQVIGAIQTIRDITDRKKMDLTILESEKKFRTLFESANDAIMMLDKKSFFDCNEKTLELYGFRSKAEFIKYHPGEVSPFFQPDGEPSVDKANRLIDIAVEKGAHAFTWIHKKVDGTLFPAEVLLSRFELGGRAVVQAVVRDITERVQGELALKRSKEELEVKSAYLEEANTALKVLLRRREEDKADLEEDVLANVRSLVIPYIERLKQSFPGPDQQMYLQVLESNLNSIISPFLRNVTLAHFNLTGREIQIANLVKEGKTNKEIAEMLNLSIRSVEFHRDNIRKKMKLDHRKANLRVFLMSLS